MGRLEVICGPMFSGKSEALIRRVRRTELARRPMWVFKPALDERYGAAHVVSHDGRRIEALSVATAGDIARALELAGALEPDTPPGLIAIDEVQFFAPDLGERESMAAMRGLVERLVASVHRIVVCGLDLDFAGRPFGIMPWLLAVAERIDKLTSVCAVCGEDAVRSQRLIDGAPAPWDAPVVLVGGAEAYEPRCLRHWRCTVPLAQACG